MYPLSLEVVADSDRSNLRCQFGTSIIHPMAYGLDLFISPIPANARPGNDKAPRPLLWEMELCVSSILYGAFVSHASSISEGFAGQKLQEDYTYKRREGQKEEKKERSQNSGARRQNKSKG